MPRTPRVTAKQIIAVLERDGFVCVRQSGSHKIFRNDRRKRATVPFHSNKTLHPKVLRNILEDAEISLKELRDLL
jgi:predicted RNA binding protein YcfA (HicA-like mRNA interferase family)